MSEIAVNHEIQGPQIQVLTEYGVYDVGDVSIVSSPTWTQALEDIKDKDFKANTVLLPELITVADKDLSQVSEQQEEVQKDLNQIIEYSKLHSEATFVVGSPHYIEGQDKPYNGAFVIKNGEIINIGHKRFGALGEENDFTMDRTHPPLKIGDTNVLICKDASGVAFGRQNSRLKESLFNMSIDNPDEVAKLMQAEFIDDSTERLLIIACWGIGMHPDIKGPLSQNQESLNKYYQRSMEYMVKTIFQYNPHLQEIIVCDRAPLSADPISDRVANKPMSVIAHR